MDAANAHELTWVAAAPLWPGMIQDRVKLRRPALLRFTTDSFMEELFADLAPASEPDSEPRDLGARVVPDGSASSPLKLFQPIHGHFHLVAASLVCQLPGLPDHAVDVAREEKAQFVIRRVVNDVEHAWIPASGASKPGEWKAVADNETLAEHEELLPLFPGAFVAEGQRRRLLFGLVPTSSGETFQAAKADSPTAGSGDGETAASSTKDPVLVPKFGARAGAFYVIRCVYRKPRCKPPEKPLLSDPTARFTIAAYFDLDAPAREIRIAMPASLAGLKNIKNRGVGLVVSDELRDTIDKSMKELKADGSDPAGSGMWLFSIPILTTVAMMLLMMIVGLLNIVLGWASLIKIWVPINLKAKE